MELKESIHFRLATRADFPSVAEWIVRVNSDPTHHCLHSYAGEEAGDLQRDFEQNFDRGELVYVLAFDGDQLIGMLGGEHDVELERGWLHGPHANEDVWENITAELYRRVVDAMPPAAQTLDAYVNVKNERARQFYGGRGFTEGTRALEYLITPPDFQLVETPQAALLLPSEHEDEFVELFEAIFPSAYYSPRRLLDMRADSHELYAAVGNGELLGFLVVQLGATAEVQFFGVRNDRRGEGIGRALLITTLWDLIDQRRINEVSLNVRVQNDGARTLYESVGFKLQCAGVGIRGSR